MHARKILYGLTAALTLSACASLVGGSDQSIRVELVPRDTTCLVLKDGVPVTSISRADKILTTQRSKHDLVFECQAPGHEYKTVRVESSAPGWGAIRCLVIDLCTTRYESGALNSYPESVTITLEKSRRADQARGR